MKPMMWMRRKKMKPTTPKRWRPRFSLRTLVILVTLVCCYAACWGPTRTRGVKDVVQLYEWVIPGWSASTSLPLVVHVDNGRTHHYYFWFFGYVAKLPYERQIAP